MFRFLFPFSKFFANIFDSEHLGRFFKDHPLFESPLFKLIKLSEIKIGLGNDIYGKSHKGFADLAFSGDLIQRGVHSFLLPINL